MASIFKRPGSQFLHIKFYDAINPLFNAKGQRVQRRESTGLRHADKDETRKARVLQAERTLAERTSRHAGHLAQERWKIWVRPFIEREISEEQRWRYFAAWRNLELWLDELKIIYPRQLTYAQCAGYLAWREQPDPKHGKYKAGRNTAVMEFKMFRWIMREAVKCGFAQGNPAREVKLRRAEPREYPNLPAEDVQFILDAIAREPEPLKTQFHRAFLLSRYHGVRLRETNVNPLRDVRLWTEPNGEWRGEITFVQKGKRVRTKPLHPELIPLFQTLRAEGAALTYPAPKSGWGNRWTRFFRRIKMPERKKNVVFHCLRVTVANLLRTANVPKELRMKYLTHEKRGDVNSGYNRVEVEEMRQCHAPLNRTWV